MKKLFFLLLMMPWVAFSQGTGLYGRVGVSMGNTWTGGSEKLNVTGATVLNGNLTLPTYLNGYLTVNGSGALGVSSGFLTPTPGANGTVLTSNGTVSSWNLILNANVSTSAAIAITKLAAGTANTVLTTNGSTNSFSSISDAFISATANITATKLATGIIDNTEFNYLDGLTSNIQTQINAKFTLPALTSGSVIFSNGTTLAQNNSQFFWNNSNNRLGLGTNAPVSLLASTSTAINDGSIAVNSTGISWASSGTGYGLGVFNSSGSTGTGGIMVKMGATSDASYIFHGVTGTSTSRFAVTASGKVGVGTGSPDSTLAVVGSARVSTNMLVGTRVNINGIDIWRNGVNNRNIFVGSNGGSLTSGYENVMVGDSAGLSITSARNNVAVGHYAMWLHQTGRQNVAVGEAAMRVSTAGQDNVAVGYQALLNNTNNNNVAVGSGALTAAGSSGNVAVGQGAGSNNTGGNNVFIGLGAGNSVSGARSSNVFIGGFSGNTVNTNSGVYISTGSGTRVLTFDPSQIPTFHGLGTGYFKLTSGVGSVSATVPPGDVTFTNDRIAVGIGGVLSSTGNLTFASNTLNVTGAASVSDSITSPKVNTALLNVNTVSSTWGVVNTTNSFGSRLAFRQAGVDFGHIANGSNIYMSGNNNDVILGSTTGRVHLGTNSLLRLTVTNAGLVGILNNAPSYTLDVAGDGRFSTSNSAVLNLNRSGVGGGYMSYSAQMANSTADMLFDLNQANSGYFFRSRNSSNAIVTSFGIDRDGNVGVGTATPTRHLHVSGTGNQTMGVTSTDGNPTQLIFNGSYGQVIASTTPLYLSTTGTNPLYLQTNAISRAYLDGTNGNFGVGLISGATHKLTVYPVDTTTYSATANQGDGMFIYNIADDNTNNNFTGIKLQIRSNGVSNAMGWMNLVQPNGATSGSDFAFKLRNAAGGYNEVMRIDGNNQRVGINITNPVYPLDLNGSIATAGWATYSGGYVIKYDPAQVTSRTWRTISNFTSYGAMEIQQSTTQTGSTFFTRLYFPQAGGLAVNGTNIAGSTMFQVNGNGGQALINLSRSVFASTSNVGGIAFSNAANNVSSGISATYTTDSTVTNLIFRAGTASTNLYAVPEVMRFNGATGHATIGAVTTGLARLHVYESGLSTSKAIGILEANGTGARPYLLFKAEGANYSYIGHGTASSGAMHILNYNNSNLYLGTNNLFSFNMVSDGSIGTGNTGSTPSPANSSVFDVQSTTKGVRFTPMTAAQRVAISTPAPGLMVYQTDGIENYYVNKSTGWASLEKTAVATTTKTASYTVTLADYTIRGNATSGNVTFTLPTAASAYNSNTLEGKVYVFKRTDASGNTFTIAGNGAETIDGTNTKTINTQYNTITVQSNGTSWDIL